MPSSQFINQSTVFFLIVGTAIGAGMVTLPILCQHLSFISILMLFSTALMIMHCSACYFVELSTEKAEQDNLLTFIQRYQHNLYWPTKVVYLLFFWSLLAVYLSALPAFCQDIFPFWPLLAQPWFQAVLLMTFLLIPHFIQAITNKVLVILMLLALTWIIGVGMSASNQEMIALYPITVDVQLLLPVMMFFGYHLTIPSLTRFVTDHNTLKRLCLLSGLFILFIYMIWSVLMLNLVRDNPLQTSGNQDFIQHIALLVNNNTLAKVAVIFSMLAMATSCMGMSIGTQDFLKDGLLFVRKSHLLSSILTVMPSLFLIYGTDGDYLKILQLASYFALYLLVILPSWLVYKKRKDDRWGPLMILMIALTLAVHAFINQFYFIS
ncbi:hypothetical protein EBR43_04585 [bacterium]|nr:hypothetical protein [bacterium]